MTSEKKRDKPPRKKGGRSPRKRGGRSKTWFGIGFWTILAIVILLAGFVLLLSSSRPQVSGKELVYTRFVELAETGRIQSARILTPTPTWSAATGAKAATPWSSTCLT